MINEPMHLIEEGLYQGPSLNTTSGLDKTWAIVNLCEYKQDGVDTAAVGAYLHFFIPDGHEQSLIWLDLVVDCIIKLRQANYKVYIHCHAGVSRSAMVTAAYLMKKWWCNEDVALNKIGSINGAIDPAPCFIKMLKEWKTGKARIQGTYTIPSFVRNLV